MQKEKIFEQLTKQIDKCRTCRLCKTRNKAVPGEGNLKAEVVFIGEGPGYNEDLQGRPFVGRAGDLLEGLLRIIGARRNDIWIGNVVKCRPPENRNPMVDEIRSCKPYLIEQLRIINPKLIIPLGRFAFEHFFPAGKISRDHGKAFRIGERIVLPLYHPAAALRSEAVLQQLKNDFRKIPRLLHSDSEEIIAVTRHPKDENQMLLI